MYYTGIDLHRKTSFITTVDAKGQIVKKVNVLNDEATIFEYFLSLDSSSIWILFAAIVLYGEVVLIQLFPN
jgi:hypothetical protein